MGVLSILLIPYQYVIIRHIEGLRGEGFKVKVKFRNSEFRNKSDTKEVYILHLRYYSFYVIMYG